MKDIDKPIYVRLGKQLKEARLKKDYSLAEVAEKIGMSKASIKRYEDASSRIDMDTLNRIADILDMQVMNTTAQYNGKTIEHEVFLCPKLETLLPGDRELQKANQYFESLTEKIMDRFKCLDVNLQKSILMTLNFSEEEISEAMEFLH